MSAPHGDGGPAFPSTSVFMPVGGRADVSTGGMSLRDWFAGQVLFGMHARDSYDPGLANPAIRATLAYADADAMLAERVK